MQGGDQQKARIMVFLFLHESSLDAFNNAGKPMNAWDSWCQTVSSVINLIPRFGIKTKPKHNPCNLKGPG